MHKIEGQAEKPRLDVILSGELKQLDLSSLEGTVGWSFAGALGQKQEFLRHMTVLRVYGGTYGITKDPDGKLLAAGLEIHLRELDENLAKRYPIKIHVVCNSITEENDFRIRRYGWRGEIYVHPIHNLGSRPVHHASTVARLARDIDADVVHVHNPSGLMATKLASKLGREDVGVAVTFHSQHNTREDDPGCLVKSTDWSVFKILFSEHLSSEGILGVPFLLGDVLSRIRGRIIGPGRVKRSLYELAEKRGGTRYLSCGLLGVSEASLEEFKSLDSMVIGDPIDANFYDPDKVSERERSEERERYGLEGRKVLAYHARIIPIKGQDILPEVADRLRASFGGGFKIVLMGTIQNREYLKGIKQNISSRKLEENFVIEEAKGQEEVRRLLSVADVFLFPTTTEALGRSGVEALLMRVPVVGSRVGGVPSYVRDGETGYLVEVGDAKAMAEKALELMKNPEKAMHMGEVGRALAVREFSSETICEDYVRFVYGPMALERSRRKGMIF